MENTNVNIHGYDLHALQVKRRKHKGRMKLRSAPRLFNLWGQNEEGNGGTFTKGGFPNEQKKESRGW